MFGGISQPQEMDFSKTFSHNKFLKRKMSKRKQMYRDSKKINKSYERTVETLRHMRSNGVSDKKIEQEINKLDKIKRSKSRINRVVKKSTFDMIDVAQSLPDTASAAVLTEPKCHNTDLVEKIRKERLKLKQGKKMKNLEQRLNAALPTIMSGRPMELLSEYGVPLLDVLHSLINAIKSARDYVGEKVLHFLIDLFTTLYNVYKNPERVGVILNISNFFIRNFEQKYADIALGWFKSAFDMSFTQSNGNGVTGYKEYILSFFSMSDEFLNDIVWTHISDFFTKIITLFAAGQNLISMETLDFPLICKKFNEFRKEIPNISDIIEMAFEAYKFVTGNWTKICSGDWRSLLLGRDETKTFEIEIRELEQAYDFVIAGQEIELKNIYNMTMDVYETRLKRALDLAKKLITRATGTAQKMSVSNFIKRLSDMQANIWARKADAPTKEESYGLKLSGPSSCGKSTLIKVLSQTMLHACGRDPKESGSVVFTNIDENFESTILPSHKIIVADDVANNKNTKPNYDRLLNYVNTVPRPLEKASAEEKGKFYPGNDCLIVTTNDKSIRATECSVCPESILRRFALDVEVSIREPFRNEFGGLVKQDTLRFDVYDLKLNRFSHIEHGPKGPIPIYEPIAREEWNPSGGDDNDFAAMCAFIAKDIKRHKKQQKTQARVQKELEESDFCSKCGCMDLICMCTNEPEAMAMAGLGDFWQGLSTQELWDIRVGLENVQNFLKNRTRMSILWYKLYKDRGVYMRSLSLILLCGLFSFLMGAKVASTTAFSAIGFMYYRYKKTLRDIDDAIAGRIDQLSSLCEDVQEHLEANSKKYFAISAGIFVAYGFYRALRPLLMSKTQDKSSYLEECRGYFSSNLDRPPKGRYTFDIQDERDYKEGYSRLPPKDTARSKTTTSKDLQISIARSLRFVVVKTRGQIYQTVNGIMVASNVLLIPAHAVPYTFPFDVETSMAPGLPNARTKDQKLTAEYCYIDRESDHAFIHLASSPASTNFADFFPEEYPSFYNRSTVLLWKAPDNEIVISRQAARPINEDLVYGGYLEKPGFLWGEQPMLTYLKLKTGTGLAYDTEFHGFGGLCGGMLLDADKGLIYGFHVAGVPKTTRGWSTCVIQPQIKKALAELRRTSPTLVVHSAGDINVDTYGMPYTIANAKPLYLREDGMGSHTTVTYVGKVLKEGQPLENRSRTPYIPTPFEGVSEALGERRHRPPAKPNDTAKAMLTLNKLHDPVQHYEGDILKRAIDDYAAHTTEVIKNDPEIADILRIYSQEEAMDGCPDVDLGGIPSDTSAGFPIGKSKKDCLIRDPMDEANVKVPREFNDKYDIQSEIDRIIDAWKQELRSEAIYKASSKVNELLPDAKARAKVRKFYGSSFANFVASRRVLGGVPKIMKKHWRTTECLVGVNPLSKEWDEFHEYLTEYSKTNMIAGDFSAFDTRMAAQITAAAAKILYSWYEAAGLSEDDLKLVAGALSDIVHPNIIFEGDLYKFANANPSGNLITVQLNSICNSIMMRYVYYAMMPKVQQPFATNVRLGTYGDDNAMSVKHHCKWYNHSTCQAEFKRLDINYTMADKDAESRPYIGIDEISFLKRGFIKHETLDIVVGPIEEDSIYKKFHWVKKSTESPLSATEQFGAYTDGALREAYLHGKDYYQDFSRRLNHIVNCNIELRGVVNFIPYEEMTQILKGYYTDDYVNKNIKLFAESIGVEEDELFFYEDDLVSDTAEDTVNLSLLDDDEDDLCL